MDVPPTSRARTGTVTVPRALLIVLSGMLLATLLAVAFLLGRETGRAQTATADLLAEAPQAPVEPAPARRAAPESRPRPAPPPRPPRPPRNDPEPAPPSGPTTPPPPTPAPGPAAPAEPAADLRERAAVARYFEEFDEIAGSNAGAGNPDAMAMALLSQATGGDWSRFDELGDTQRVMLRQLRGLRVPPVCREHHQKMITLLEAGAALLDDVRQGVQSGNLGALSTLTTTAQRLQTDAEEVSRLAAAIQQRYQL